MALNLLCHEVKCAFAYSSHLDNTLFLKRGRATWERMYKMLDDKDLRVSACTTQANRSFHIQCLCCGKGRKGHYGHNDDETVHEEARQALSMFLLNEPASDNGKV